MTLQQFWIYLRNEDSSSIQFKSFKLSSTNNYPAISICFKIDENHVFDESKLPKNVSSQDMVRLVEGDPTWLQDITSDLGSKILSNLSNDNQSAYDNYLNGMVGNMVWGYTSETMTYKFKDMGDNAEVLQNDIGMIGSNKFTISLQAPTTHCMTRTVNYTPHEVVVSESIPVSIKLLKYCKYMAVYIHQPKQLIRSSGSMGVGTPVMKMEQPYEFQKENDHISIVISSIRLIQKRHDARNPCNRDLDDDDTEWMKTVSKIVGCVPIYWKRFLSTWMLGIKIGFCTKYSEYSTIQYYLDNRWNITTLFDPPCRKMTISNYVSRERYPHEEQRALAQMFGLVWMKFWYKTDEYEEISNWRLFNGESLFSQVGGFVGIMLGVSILQMPDLLMSIFAWLKENYKKLVGVESSNPVAPLPLSTRSTGFEEKWKVQNMAKYRSVRLK